MSREMMFPESCIVHMTSHDGDCEACGRELALIQQQTIDANRETVRVISHLDLAGYEVDPLVHVSTRLDTLIDSLMGRNPKQSAKFDATVAVNVLREMVRQQDEIARQTLLQR